LLAESQAEGQVAIEEVNGALELIVGHDAEQGRVIGGRGQIFREFLGECLKIGVEDRHAAVGETDRAGGGLGEFLALREFEHEIVPAHPGERGRRLLEARGAKVADAVEPVRAQERCCALGPSLG
jgi:hypothetical protein